MTTTTHVLYLAHPVAGEVNANVARAGRWLRWLQRRYPQLAFIAPWIADLVSGADDADPAQRAQGLRHGCIVAARCDGIVLVGGRVTGGMLAERDAVVAAGGAVIDLTELGDEPPCVTEELIDGRLGEGLDPARRAAIAEAHRA